MSDTNEDCCKPSFLSFRGRARRRTYWGATLAIGLPTLAVACFAAMPIVCAIADGGMDDFDAVLSAYGCRLLAALAVALVAFFLLLPVNVRRLHDRNMSGWWLLAFWIGGTLPYVGGLIGVVQFVIMGCLAGTPGQNRYGMNPRECK
jgi:uncharacterized membrane protein YhaH (DUF805 family)